MRSRRRRHGAGKSRRRRRRDLEVRKRSETDAESAPRPMSSNHGRHSSRLLRSVGSGSSQSPLVPCNQRARIFPTWSSGLSKHSLQFRPHASKSSSRVSTSFSAWARGGAVGTDARPLPLSRSSPARLRRCVDEGSSSLGDVSTSGCELQFLSPSGRLVGKTGPLSFFRATPGRAAPSLGASPKRSVPS